MGAPFYAEVADAPPGARARWLRTADGTRLRAVFWRGGARGTVFVFPGRTEYAEKYGRVVGKLLERGLGVAVIDWRGQGLSDRPAAFPKLGHVNDFRDYQHDVAAFLDAPDAKEMVGPRYLFSHSMGGCVGLRAVLERTDFAGAVFCAPMWNLRMRGATREITMRLTQMARVLGLGGRRMPGAGGRSEPMAAGFSGNALTSDPEQFAWALRQVTTHPDLWLGGPTVQWTQAALREMARLYVAPLPRLPMLGCLGDGEIVVSPATIHHRFGAMEDGELLVCPGGRHELLLETPEIQAPLWRSVDAFLARVAAGKG